MAQILLGHVLPVYMPPSSRPLYVAPFVHAETVFARNAALGIMSCFGASGLRSSSWRHMKILNIRLAVSSFHTLPCPAGGFALGYGVSRGLGVPERQARTNSIEVGMQNSALAAVLCSIHFPAHPLAPVPCAISACLHSLLGSALAGLWRLQPPPCEPDSLPAPA